MVSAGSKVPKFSDTCDFLRRRWVAMSSALVVLPCLLQGCGNSEPKGLAKGSAVTGIALASPDASGKGDSLFPPVARIAPVDTFEDRYAFGDSFADRYGRDSFADRYGAAETYGRRFAREAAGDRSGSNPPGSYKLASLTPGLPYGLPAIKQAQTRLIGFENSAFPYPGKSYDDNRVLVHVPAGFDARKPGVIVVFFHGHGATLERDVRDRQLLPKQITESGVNAVLVAPQLAYDAADSSAGKFRERGGLKRFLTEAAAHFGEIYGDPRAAEAFAKMPVMIVAYSGGFVSAAYSLQVGALGNRVMGVVLLDALYGELDKFSSWIVNHRSAFFVSAYTAYTKHRDDELARILRDKGISVADELDGPLKPGSVAFLPTGEGVRHRDYVTLAWTQHPVRDVLLRISQH
jgi:hypothetical protein